MGWVWMFFAFGGFWFWTLVAVEVCWLFSCMARDRGTPATVSVLIVAGLLALFGGPNIFRYAIDHPGRFATYLGGYVAAGTVWAVIKWWFYVHRRRREYDDKKAGFLRSNNVVGNSIPDGLKLSWKESLRYVDVGPPQVRRHKSDILFWMTFWPFSLLWTMIDDVVTRIFEEIYHGIQSILQGISNRAFRGIENDMPADDPDDPRFDRQPGPSRAGSGMRK